METLFTWLALYEVPLEGNNENKVYLKNMNWHFKQRLGNASLPFKHQSFKILDKRFCWYHHIINSFSDVDIIYPVAGWKEHKSKQSAVQMFNTKGDNGKNDYEE